MFKWCTRSHFGVQGELIKLKLSSLIRFFIANNNITNTPNAIPVSLVGQGQYVFLISILRRFYWISGNGWKLSGVFSLKNTTQQFQGYWGCTNSASENENMPGCWLCQFSDMGELRIEEPRLCNALCSMHPSRAIPSPLIFGWSYKLHTNIYTSSTWIITWLQSPQITRFIHFTMLMKYTPSPNKESTASITNQQVITNDIY